MENLFQTMLYELESQKIEVCLIPLPDGRKKRVAFEQNPEWYRRFCALYESGRSRPRKRSKSDTLIKRRATIAALRKLQSGINDTIYTERILEFVESQNREYEPVDVGAIPC